MGQRVHIEQTLSAFNNPRSGLALFSLYAGSTADIELPEKYTWDDVEDLFIKWDTLHLFMKDNRTFEIELDSSTDDIVDWKRPKYVQVYSADEDGEPDFDDVIYEQE